MSGYAGSTLAGGQGGMQAPAKEQTTIQRLNDIVERELTALQACCSRLENFADRLEPTPKTAAGAEKAEKEPPLNHDLQGMNQRLSNLANSLEWLNEICNRLERIA